MANRRMFTKKVTDDDNFMALSSSAQALYLHLSMSADDDGFSNQVSISMFKAHASIQDLQALLEKRYIYQFDNGVIVIKHWRMANALRKDRYSPTAFQEELAQLGVKENGAYTRLTDGCQTVAERVPQVRLGKVRLDKDSLGEVSIEDVCTEPLQSSAPETAMNAPGIPIKGGVEWRPTVNELNEWIKFYSAVDVIRELGRMRIWCQNNPDRKKTARGIRRFVTTWLDKEQNRAGHYTRGQQRQATGADAYFEMAQEAMGNGTGGN